ncbi:MAG: ribosome maturation factor RimM [Desulfitobacteriaceae bacterium]|nr:ribosome maturation factor RimM [Desulfitobacteriaceae bacterium]MDD4752711.1 ribosome maturation factor RimM [Desulfitobacteriaceae bacterium]
MEQRIDIGKILVPHGVKGEVKVLPLTDFPDRFVKMKRVWVDTQNSFLDIESIRFQNKIVLIKFAGVNNRDEGETLKGGLLQISHEEVVPLPPGHYYHFQIVGLNVFDHHGEKIGRVKEILKTGANDIYVVKRDEGKDLLVPALKKIVREIDVAAGRMVVDLPPGLDD